MSEAWSFFNENGQEIAIFEPEVNKVFAWRIEAFEEMGFDSVEALRLASDTDVDIHRVKGLLDKGCSRALAIKISS